MAISKAGHQATHLNMQLTQMWGTKSWWVRGVGWENKGHTENDTSSDDHNDEEINTGPW